MLARRVCRSSRVFDLNASKRLFTPLVCPDWRGQASSVHERLEQVEPLIFLGIAPFFVVCAIFAHTTFSSGPLGSNMFFKWRLIL